MSHARAALHCKVRALRRTRDQLEPMVHSGPADAQELWEELEKRWRDLDDQAKHLTRGTEDALDGVADMVTELRQGYDRLAAGLREPRSESLWGQVRNRLDRLVQGGHRTTERVAGSVEELADAATVRIRKPRLERTRTKRRAELGTRVYELAKEQARFEGRPPQVLDDDQVKAPSFRTSGRWTPTCGRETELFIRVLHRALDAAPCPYHRLTAERIG